MAKVKAQAMIINNTTDHSLFLENISTRINEWQDMGDLEFHYQQSDQVMSCLVICRERESNTKN